MHTQTYIVLSCIRAAVFFKVSQKWPHCIIQHKPSLTFSKPEIRVYRTWCRFLVPSLYSCLIHILCAVMRDKLVTDSDSHTVHVMSLNTERYWCHTVDKPRRESRSPAAESKGSSSGTTRGGNGAAKTSLRTSGRNSDGGMLTGVVPATHQHIIRFLI